MDLSFATTDELVDELNRRFGATLIVLMGDMKNGGPPDSITTKLAHSGPMPATLGLAVYALEWIRRKTWNEPLTGVYDQNDGD